MRKAFVPYLLVLIFVLIPFFSSPASAVGVYAPRYTLQQAVAAGLVPGHSWIDKFGLNNLITTATDPEDVWEFGGMYEFSPDGTFPDVGIADIVSCSSSSASDIGVIELQGLDADGYEQTVSLTLNGQTRVEITSPFWRLYRIQNEYR